MPALAHRLLAAGAFGVTCAKVGEAEVMAAAGIRDILVADQVIGEPKVRRLAYLCAQADVVVAADSPAGIAQLDRAAAEAGTHPRMVVEVDTGMGRCGVVGYSDSTVFLHDVLYGTRNGVVQAAWEIAGRGKLW